MSDKKQRTPWDTMSRGEIAMRITMPKGKVERLDWTPVPKDDEEPEEQYTTWVDEVEEFKPNQLRDALEKLSHPTEKAAAEMKRLGVKNSGD